MGRDSFISSCSPAHSSSLFSDPSFLAPCELASRLVFAMLLGMSLSMEMLALEVLEAFALARSAIKLWRDPNCGEIALSMKRLTLKVLEASRLARWAIRLWRYPDTGKSLSLRKGELWRY